MQTRPGKLSNRKHFRSIQDSGVGRFSVSALFQEQCMRCSHRQKQDLCRRGWTQHWTRPWEERTTRLPQCKHSTSLPSTDTAIHNEAMTLTTSFFLTVGNIHLNKPLNVTSQAIHRYFHVFKPAYQSVKQGRSLQSTRQCHLKYLSRLISSQCSQKIHK